MSNQDLYKQAIAEAKSVRETAIANAKLALEESLTPHLKELLAQKLQEMEEEEMEEEVNEMEDTMEEEEIVAEAEESDEDEAEDSEEAEDDSEESEDEAEESTEDEEIEDMTVEDLKDLIRDILAQEMGAEDEMDMGMETPEAGEDMDGMDMVSADDEEINIDEILSELAEEEKAMEEEQLDEATPDVITLATYLADQGIQNADMIAKAIMGGAGALGIGGLAKLADVITRFQEKKAGKKSQKEGTSKELNEAHKTIQSLRKDLNEVNLLNAKLLYVNKVFKANNLTEAQKANVIAAFDKAETVKEAKLVYESISSSVVAESKKPKRVVREHKSFASKAVGVAPKKEVISEANDVVKRMQKLAGIIK